jgi:hypothetical protein
MDYADKRSAHTIKDMRMIATLIRIASLLGAQAHADSSCHPARLQSLIDSAASRNAEAAQQLVAYRATVESESGLIFEDSVGRPRGIGMQQQFSRVRWTRDGFNVQVEAERPPVRMRELEGWAGPTWMVPALYGEGFAFVFPHPQRDGDGARSTAFDTLFVPHPFGAARNMRYCFSGGERALTMLVGNRQIPIVHLRVTPRFVANEDGTGFDGDLYLETRGLNVVRARGRLILVVNSKPRVNQYLSVTGTTFASYIDVTNAEVDGRFWLPAHERVEFQITTGMLAGTRSIMRFTADFDNRVVDSLAGIAARAPEPRVRVSYVSEDSLRQHHDWPTSLGERTTAVRGSDFDDLAPDRWSTSGAPMFTMVPSQSARIVRFNTVEGLFTGLEGTLSLRDAAPGASVRAFGGWAWSEHALRGGASAGWNGGGHRVAIQAERSLESTNDFVSDVTLADPLIAGLLESAMQHDYLDRQVVMLSAGDVRRSFGDAIVSAQIGFGRDRSEVTRVRRLLIPVDGDSVLENRAARPGSYRRLVVDYELRPEVSALTPTPGFSTRLHYEVGQGTLRWQRATSESLRRDDLSGVAIVERLDLGVVAGSNLPPQQLFELGGWTSLQGYAYKQFAGDRAALASIAASHLFDATRALRLQGAPNWLPPVAPGLSAGFEVGWTTLSTAASAAVLELAPASPTPISVATNGIRGSGGFGFTLFSGLVHVGLARSFDVGSKWRGVAGVGTRF